MATGSFVDYAELLNTMIDLELQMVPILAVNTVIGEPGYQTVDSFIKLATIKTTINLSGVWAEGIVVRPLIESTHRKLGRFSFKAINPEFSLKYD